jgi:large subunit ribosomal protein L4
MASVKVLDVKGKETGAMELKPDVFGVSVRTPLLHQAVVREMADRRAGTHDTRGRSEVSGGGKKPWKQKGTGRARQGSIRATQWKGGGKPFGPTPRSYAKAMPREMRREALRAAVAAKIEDGGLRVVESLTSDGKTKSLVASLAALGAAGAPTLLVTASLSEPLARAARNVPWLMV